MKLDELALKVGRVAKVDDKTARRVIRAVVGSVREELAGAKVDERITVPALGSFVLREGKEGKSRISFNLAKEKAEKGKEGQASGSSGSE